MRSNIRIKKTPSHKVYVVGGSIGYANWLPNTVLCNSIEECDVVMFTGGADINPAIYKDVKHKTTSYSEHRDKIELEAYNKAIKLNKKFIGICRGAQLLCALAGGKLIQHQNNAHYIHPVYLESDKNVVHITSMHHQAMFPFYLPSDSYRILGYAKDHSKYHYNGKGEEMMPAMECEIVYFRKNRALCIQGHPEALWPVDQVEYVKLFINLNSMYEGLLEGTL